MDTVCTWAALQGLCLHVDANGDFLAAVTDAGVLKLWKTSGREAKPHGPGTMLKQQGRFNTRRKSSTLETENLLLNNEIM
jgi:hypothetical protein